MSEDLVVGYGNELRSDDGMGPRIAREVEGWEFAGVRAIACRQLTPELAGAVSEARRVVFVDASVGASGPVRLDRLEPADSAHVLVHAMDPRLLLGLAGRLYGRCPPAWLLALPAANFEFGESLSAGALENVRLALARLRLFLRDGPAAPAHAPAFASSPGMERS